MDILKDIAQRTNGDIYIGVVGPVRSGKSTFIKRFMDKMVLPVMSDEFEKKRAIDELPQSAEGKTIMTTEPKFIPNKSAKISLGENVSAKIKLIDCVGYVIPDCLGYEEDGHERMVQTPWFEESIPFVNAAEIGTKKVISEHSTIGLVITTDGSIVDIDRDNYIEAEKRVIDELNELNKPFVVLLNSTKPKDKETIELCDSMSKKYNVPVICADCANLNENDIAEILKTVLYEFPVSQIDFSLPSWIKSLDITDEIKTGIYDTIKNYSNNISKLRDCVDNIGLFNECGYISSAKIENLLPGNGEAKITMSVPESLFYDVLSNNTGIKITSDYELMSIMKELASKKQKFDKFEEALNDVKEKGYGIVNPGIEELTLEEPQIVKQGNKYGVMLKASAPSIHMLRADIETTVSPIVGTERQSEELVRYLLSDYEENPAKIWETNIFGKSLNELVNEGLQNKLSAMPEDARGKLRETVTKIINEGSGGLICIIL